MSSSARNMSIGQLSRRTGVNIETIRYYERAGLMPKPQRTKAGYRLYGHDDVRRLTLVRKSRSLGFSLGDARVLLQLAVKPDASRPLVRSLVIAQLRGVRSKIADLRRMERALRGMLVQCKGEGQGQCPILGRLSASFDS